MSFADLSTIMFRINDQVVYLFWTFLARLVDLIRNFFLFFSSLSLIVVWSFIKFQTFPLHPGLLFGLVVYSEHDSTFNISPVSFNKLWCYNLFSDPTLFFLRASATVYTWMLGNVLSTVIFSHKLWSIVILLILG